MDTEYKQKLDSVRNEDKYALIILDACRYDALNYLVNKVIKQDIQKVNSGVPNTHTWIKSYWMGDYDATYISGFPWVANKPVTHHNAGVYDGSKHFSKVVESWSESWSKEDNTVLPQHLAEDAKNNIADKMIIHFGQPHFPHIGEPYLGKGHIDNIEQFDKQDELDDAYLKRSYQANLAEVWDLGVKNLQEIINEEDRKVVITADHGEALGENDWYGHNRCIEPVLEVPWLEW